MIVVPINIVTKLTGTMILVGLPFAFYACSRSSGPSSESPSPDAAMSTGGSPGVAVGGAGGDVPLDALPTKDAQPVTIPNPILAEFCKLTGKMDGVVDGVCPLHTDGWDWDQEAGILAANPGQSALPSCSVSGAGDLVGLDSPGWRLRIDKVVGPEKTQNSLDDFSTALFVTRLDGAKPCALRVILRLKQRGVKLASGNTVHFAYRYTIRNVEDDVSFTAVLRDDNGVFLMGMASGVRPAVWDKDMWPELALEVESGKVCSDQRFPTRQDLRFSLVSGNEKCTLESHTARCCSFGGKSFEVMSPYATRSAYEQGTVVVSGGATPVDKIAITVARPGILVPAP
jgi:hypothetical protein